MADLVSQKDVRRAAAGLPPSLPTIIITAPASNPAPVAPAAEPAAGDDPSKVSSLFFFCTVASHLAVGGFAGQWLKRQASIGPGQPPPLPPRAPRPTHAAPTSVDATATAEPAASDSSAGETDDAQPLPPVPPEEAPAAPVKEHSGTLGQPRPPPVLPAVKVGLLFFSSSSFFFFFTSW